jgi:hypothetical protein
MRCFLGEPAQCARPRDAHSHGLSLCHCDCYSHSLCHCQSHSHRDCHVHSNAYRYSDAFDEAW